MIQILVHIYNITIFKLVRAEKYTSCYVIFHNIYATTDDVKATSAQRSDYHYAMCA